MVRVLRARELPGLGVGLETPSTGWKRGSVIRRRRRDAALGMAGNKAQDSTWDIKPLRLMTLLRNLLTKNDIQETLGSTDTPDKVDFASKV